MANTLHEAVESIAKDFTSMFANRVACLGNLVGPRAAETA
jgi:hypothetical protein